MLEPSNYVLEFTTSASVPDLFRSGSGIVPGLKNCRTAATYIYIF